MSDKPSTPTTEDTVPNVSLRQFLRGLANHHAPEDEALSANTLRMMIGDLREHARRFHAEMQEDQTQ